MKKQVSKQVIEVPLNYIIDENGKIKYDFKAMRTYFNLRLKMLGE
tara:strand:+ start:1626 stop:1760 length:135 start_codon:yes stop_codon:yes gene_type:complete